MFDRRDALFDKSSSWFSLVDPARCSTEFGEVCKATSRQHTLHYLEASLLSLFLPYSSISLRLRVSICPSSQPGDNIDYRLLGGSYVGPAAVILGERSV